MRKLTRKISCIVCLCLVVACVASVSAMATEEGIEVGNIIQAQIFLPAGLNPDGVDGYITDYDTYVEYMQKFGNTPGTEVIAGTMKYMVLDDYYLEAIEQEEIAPLPLTRGTTVPTASGDGNETGSYSMTTFIYNNKLHNTANNWLQVDLSPTTTHTLYISAMDASVCPIIPSFLSEQNCDRHFHYPDCYANSVYHYPTLISLTSKTDGFQNAYALYKTIKFYYFQSETRVSELPVVFSLQRGSMEI